MAPPACPSLGLFLYTNHTTLLSAEFKLSQKWPRGRVHSWLIHWHQKGRNRFSMTFSDVHISLVPGKYVLPAYMPPTSWGWVKISINIRLAFLIICFDKENVLKRGKNWPFYTSEIQTEFSRNDSGVSEILIFLQASHSLGRIKSSPAPRVSALDLRTARGHCRGAP